MPYADLDEARRHHAALRNLFLHDAELARRAPLRVVEALCRDAAAAVDDPYCREEMGIVADYAAEFFSQRSHRRYESESLPGGEFLRVQILKALDAFASRLYSLEALRRAAELRTPRFGGPPPQIREA
jgi:hypothetical protein